MNNIEDALADLEKSKNQSGTIVPANYEINSTLVQDYIQNRPFWYFQSNQTFAWDGMSSLNEELDNMGWIENSDVIKDFSLFDQQTISYTYLNENYSAECTLVNNSNIASMDKSFSGIVLFDYGDVYAGIPNEYGTLMVLNLHDHKNVFLGEIYGEYGASQFNLDIQSGLYSPNLNDSAIVENECATFRAMELIIEKVVCDNRYVDFFNNIKSKSYLYNVVIDPDEGYDYSRYPTGSALVIVDTHKPVTSEK